MGLGDTVMGAVEAAEASGTLPEGSSSEDPIENDDEGTDDEGTDDDAGSVDGEGDGGDAKDLESKPADKKAGDDKTDEKKKTDEKWLNDFGTRHKLKKRPDGRWNPIPHFQWQKMAASEVKGARAEIGKMLGLADTVDYTNTETFTAAVKEALGDIEGAKARNKALDELIPYMKDPKMYMQILAGDDEFGAAYKPYLKHFTEQQEEAKEARKEAKEEGFTEAEPKPDQEKDGVKGWSEEGWKKWNEWNEKRITHSVRSSLTKEFETKFGDQIKPLKEAHEKGETTRQTLERRETALKELLDEASEWPMWADVQEDVRKLVTGDESLKKITHKVPETQMRRRMHTAYMKTVLKKLTTDRAAIWEELEAKYKAGTKPDGLKPDGAKVVEDEKLGDGTPGSLILGAVRKAQRGK